MNHKFTFLRRYVFKLRLVKGDMVLEKSWHMGLCSEILLSVSFLTMMQGTSLFSIIHVLCFFNKGLLSSLPFLLLSICDAYVAGLLEPSLQRAISTAADVQEQVHGERDPSLFVVNLAWDPDSPKNHPAQASESQPWIRDLRHGQNTRAKVREREPTRNRIQFQDEYGRDELRKRREGVTQKREENRLMLVRECTDDSGMMEFGTMLMK